jgi:hypothetical protein
MRATIDPIEKEFREYLEESGACRLSVEDQKAEPEGYNKVVSAHEKPRLLGVSYEYRVNPVAPAARPERRDHQRKHWPIPRQDGWKAPRDEIRW